MSARASRSSEPTPQPSQEDDTQTREALAGLLMPLDLVVLTRERIQATLDEAVERGRLSRADATDLAGALFERGRRQTEDLLADVEQLRRRTNGRVTPPADRVLREVDPARPVVGLGASFPVPAYDELTAAQVTGRISGLSPAELRRVLDYEKRNANRKGVLAAVEQKLG